MIPQAEQGFDHEPQKKLHFVFNSFYMYSFLLSVCMFNQEKSVILFFLTVRFILSPVANFRGIASQRVRKEAGKRD